MNARATLPALLAVAALAGCSDPYADTPKVKLGEPATDTQPAPTQPRSVINSQDRTSAEHRRREDAAMRERPLLDHLPMTIGDVEISIYGLAADDRHTVLQITAPDEATGRDAYRAALRAHADRGTAYEPRYVTP